MAPTTASATTPASVLVMPYSVCDSSLSLVEATHVFLSHPYAGPDLTLSPVHNKDVQRVDAERARWTDERWEHERWKWREIERRAVSCVVRAGQTRSIQVRRFYAPGTREAELAQQFGDPVATTPGRNSGTGSSQPFPCHLVRTWHREAG
ncbi:hypothetical protein BC828DRAFT_267421 [Blastocladiella britannica]|nr:hypothetical protein BC828DRAFT_267421 [Blastocladiella britannica]